MEFTVYRLYKNTRHIGSPFLLHYYDYDKLCILAVYRSPLGNFDNFLANLDLVLQKLFLSKSTFIICGDININYFADSYKKKQLDSILYSFNLCSIVNFPTRIGPFSSSTIDNVFIDNSYLNKYDIAQVIKRPFRP
jgi:hypothetical protein